MDRLEQREARFHQGMRLSLHQAFGDERLHPLDRRQAQPMGADLFDRLQAATSLKNR